MMCASTYQEKWRDAYEEISLEEDRKYLISEIIKGFTHLYEEKNDESKTVCTGETVKTDNLKEPPAEVSKMKDKICEDCIEESEI